MEAFKTESLSDALRLFILKNRLGPGLFRQAVFEAWDESSGAAPYSVNKYFRDGVLYVTISSSVIRNDLRFQIDDILGKMNGILDSSEIVMAAGISERVTKIVLR